MCGCFYFENIGESPTSIITKVVVPKFVLINEKPIRVLNATPTQSKQTFEEYMSKLRKRKEENKLKK